MPGWHDHLMAEETDDSGVMSGASGGDWLHEARPATLGDCHGRLSAGESGWTWRGRIPLRVLATLLRSAVRGCSVGLVGPPGVPERVSVRELSFDAENCQAACELSPVEGSRGVS